MPDVQAVIAFLQARSTEKELANLKRFGITTDKPIGVSMKVVQAAAKEFGRSHELAAELWKTGWYEARLLCAYVDEPERVTPAQMDRWCKDFDNWGICDTLCFVLFDRTPHAWGKVEQWADRKEEFVRRAAFALLASIAGHDKKAADQLFLDTFPLIADAASDPRDLVRKGVSWALRRIGTRNAALHKAACELAEKLAKEPETRWVGRDAYRYLQARPARKSHAAL
jgi:3-methyladenine DNA glycosylase AlkD